MCIKQSNLEELFERLDQSGFRRRFKLRKREQAYLQEKGLAVIEQHARDFVTERLAPAAPKNDGRQTPMRNHPVFVAQHATATCCRKCLKKWHAIEMNTPLSKDNIDYIVAVIMEWLVQKKYYKNFQKSNDCFSRWNIHSG